ncbi:MAG: YIP1 family protein [Clostridiales bacterium]|nr:YIP1 family protein [Clostridiales bacterium]
MSAVKRIMKVLGHPSSELYEMKYYKVWPILPTVVILLAWYATEVLAIYATDFKFNYNNLTNVNILYTFASTVGLFLLWTVVNWAVTTLLDGKGSIREIFCATSYALIPYVAVSILCVVMSHLLIMEEESFMTIFRAFGLLYSLLIFVSAMATIHDYSMAKAILSILLSLAGIVFILFLLVLFFGLLQQVTLFVQTVYMELQLRR